MKIKYIPYQPHCFAFGGFEIQMLATLDAVKNIGIDAGRIDIWSRDADFEILHCWGLGFHHYENIRWAKHAQKKVVLTALLSYYEGALERIRHFFSTYIKKAQYYIQIANMADAVVVVNDLQADICHKYFKVPVKNIEVIPNIIHPSFFENIPTRTFADKYNLSDYILTVGSVCARKNQLTLAKACVRSNRNLVVIGKVLDGEGKYGSLLSDITKENLNVTWIPGLSANSEELISAYQSALAVALPSHVEQQPITLLEAVAVRKPLIIANKSYALQTYYTNACLVDPNSEQSIVNGIEKVAENPTKFIAPMSAIEECRQEKVGTRYAELYDRLL